MLFPEKMLYVRVKIPKDKVDEEIQNIGKASVLHIDQRKGKKVYLEEEKRVSYLYNLSEKCIDILRLKKEEKVTVSRPLSLEDIERELMVISSEIDTISNLDKEVGREVQILEKVRMVERSLSDTLNLRKLVQELKIIKISAGIIPVENLEPAVLSVKEYGGFAVSKVVSEGSCVIVILYTEDIKDHIDRILDKNRVEVLPVEYFSKKKEDEISGKLKKLEEKRRVISQKYGKDILVINAVLKSLEKIYRVKESLDLENEYFILYGWIPYRKRDLFLRSVRYSKVDLFPAGEDAPVLLRTPKIFKPFERLIENFSYPKYGEINPTIPFGVTFLLLFGIMFGDVGHGFTLSAVGYFLRKRYKDAGEIFILTGFSSAFFGFLYGSFFGFHGVIPSILFPPIENIERILTLSIAVGIMVITAGFILNMISLVKRKKFVALITGEGGLLWFLIYWYLIGIFVKGLVFNTDIKYDLVALGFLLFISFIIILYRTKTVTGSIIDTLRELLEYFTNTISFIRLGAFALAHSALFLAVFTVAKLIETERGGGFLYWLVIVGGNVFIIVLEGIIVAIQTLRLEYYEFFKRFYVGGGIPYRPFSLP
ncbi:V-type ATP synthase subunit I [Persephonella sp.]